MCINNSSSSRNFTISIILDSASISDSCATRDSTVICDSARILRSIVDYQFALNIDIADFIV